MHTRFTLAYGLSTPIALAPMALAAGGALAAACAQAGALGLLGGGYGELGWLQREHALAISLLPPEGLPRLGCGFITWKLDEDASALDWLLDQTHLPAALMLSFGDPRPYAKRLAARGVPLICQIQQLAQLHACLEAGAVVVVAQGAEAGGHGMNALNGRSTFTLVPELADALAAQAPSTLLLA
ncbi:MAG: nitronate monooxygenase, partial [Betaproteobacteria bacterium]|nr:nitronate monooxygenase [Betaproteobacteria bacterium]